MKSLDLTEKKFGMLTAIRRTDSNGRIGVYWHCICDCGKECDVHSHALVSGHTKSCGCYQKLHPSNVVHGLSKTKEHCIWKGIRQRCNNPNASNFYRYGGRGIRVCEEWNNFENFYRWCKESGYKYGLTIDRIDNNGDYSPSNCRWVDKTAQANNKCNNRKVRYKGKIVSLMELERITGIDHRTIGYRLTRGWSVEQASTIAPKYGNRIVYSND